jgi:hypothetical protein
MSWVERRRLLANVERARKSRAVLYVTGDRPKQETRIHPEVLDLLVEHLDAIGVTKRISLILYTRGGDGMAAWSLFNLVRMFCDDFEIIVPSKAHSAGTMIAIGANRIIMTKQATLSPIDPTLNHALAPPVRGSSKGSRAPVSVEAIRGYLDLVKDTLGEAASDATGQIMLDLARQVHPLVLGETYRRRQQTQQLGEKLLSPHVKDAKNRRKIITFLSSDSGSHDYTINRREAAALGLPVMKCPEKLYGTLNAIYRDFREEMLLSTPFEATQFPPNATSPFVNTRAIIESTASSPMHFVTEGTYSRQPATSAKSKESSVEITFEGWRSPRLSD